MKLSPDDIALCRAIYHGAEKKLGLIRVLAREFGVSAWWMGRVVRGVAR